MAVPETGRAAGQRDVDRARDRARGADGGQPVGEPQLDVRLEMVDELSQPRTFIGRDLPERLQESGDQPALASEIAVADGPKVSFVRRCRDLAIELLPERVDVRGWIWKRRHSRFKGSQGSWGSEGSLVEW